MSSIVSLSPWSTFWSMGKEGGTSSEFIAVKALKNINPQVLHFVEDSSPCDEGNIPIPVHLENSNRWQSRILGGLGLMGQRFRFELTAKKWRQYNDRFFVHVMAEFGKRKVDSIDLVYCHSALLVECGRRLGATFECPVIAYFYGTFLAPCIGKREAYWKHATEYLGWTTPVDLHICLDDGTKGNEVARDLGLRDFLFRSEGLDIERLNSRVDTPLINEVIPQNTLCVMTASRLASWKRVDRLLRAIPQVIQHVKNVRFVIVGDGPEREKLERLSRELDVSEWVKFVGPVAQEIVFAFMRKCDVFVSTNDFSNLSHGLKQAMYLGMCVVGTDTGNTCELIKDDITGKLVPPDHKAALANSLIEVLSQQELRRRLGTSASEFIKANEPTQDAILTERVAVLKALIDKYSKQRNYQNEH